MIIGVIVGVVVLLVVAVIGIVLLRGRSGSGRSTATSTTVGAVPAPASGAATTDSADSSSPEISSPASDATPKRAVALTKGDCIVDLPTTTSIITVDVVPCTSLHKYQVGVTYSPSKGAFPGSSSLSASADAQCPGRVGPVIQADAPKLKWTALIPDENEWNGGDHSIKCLLLDANDGTLARSVVK